MHGSRNFRQGGLGGGGSRLSRQKKTTFDNVYIIFYLTFVCLFDLILYVPSTIFQL